MKRDLGDGIEVFCDHVQTTRTVTAIVTVAEGEAFSAGNIPQVTAQSELKRDNEDAMNV